MRRDSRQPAFPGCLGICELPALAEASRAAGRPDSAILVYERFLAVPDLHRGMVDAVWRGRVRERLSTLYREAGDGDRAAVHARALEARSAEGDAPRAAAEAGTA